MHDDSTSKWKNARESGEITPPHVASLTGTCAPFELRTRAHHAERRSDRGRHNTRILSGTCQSYGTARQLSFGTSQDGHERENIASRKQTQGCRLFGGLHSSVPPPFPQTSSRGSRTSCLEDRLFDLQAKSSCEYRPRGFGAFLQVWLKIEGACSKADPREKGSWQDQHREEGHIGTKKQDRMADDLASALVLMLCAGRPQPKAEITGDLSDVDDERTGCVRLQQHGSKPSHTHGPFTPTCRRSLCDKRTPHTSLHVRQRPGKEWRAHFRQRTDMPWGESGDAEDKAVQVPRDLANAVTRDRGCSVRNDVRNPQ